GFVYLHPIAVVTGQTAHRADPDQAVAVLRDRRGSRVRKPFGDVDTVEPGRVERGPWIGSRGGDSRRTAGKHGEQPGQLEPASDGWIHGVPGTSGSSAPATTAA